MQNWAVVLKSRFRRWFGVLHDRTTSFGDDSHLDCRLSGAVLLGGLSVPVRQSAGGPLLAAEGAESRKLQIYECGEPTVGSALSNSTCGSTSSPSSSSSLMWKWRSSSLGPTVFGKATHLRDKPVPADGGTATRRELIAMTRVHGRSRYPEPACPVVPKTHRGPSMQTARDRQSHDLAT